MTKAELRQFLKENGRWSLAQRIIKGHPYFYAVKRIPGSRRMRDIYLVQASKLAQKSEADILAKLPVLPNK